VREGFHRCFPLADERCSEGHGQPLLGARHV
jgi:hypothetical protein